MRNLSNCKVWTPVVSLNAEAMFAHADFKMVFMLASISFGVSVFIFYVAGIIV